ncbi:hypothetical protein HHK36_027124 [Tetracentron sinense]|uniref:Ninja-family protein n=1 Tax=Tetracentron sinense TaxID=13715 RepID=A0A834YGT2_TETSI|nr:hypothetical protein HHK36_027124 [Tetracentron sinense]
MANGCALVEMEENEVELSLGLSIGGSFRKPEKSIQIQQKLVPCLGKVNVDLKEDDQSLGRASESPIFNGVFSARAEFLDLQRKREIHALRRRETRKKREEKQQKKGICRGRNGGYVNDCSMDDKMWLEEHDQFQARVRDREAKENENEEANRSERISKKEKTENGGSAGSCVEDSDSQNTNLILKNYQTLNQNPRSNQSAYASPPFPLVQYVGFPNGIPFPYAMPCWALPGAAVCGGDDKNVFRPVAFQSLWPFRPPPYQNSNPNCSRSCNSEQNSSEGGTIKQAQSSPASSGSHSAFSSYHSRSQEGGSSSDARNQSSFSPSKQSRLNTSEVNNAQGQSDHSASSHSLESTLNVDAVRNYTDKAISSNIAKSSSRKPEEEPVAVTEPIHLKCMREANGDKNKPHFQLPRTSSIPSMPCVSTTGNGPNGKTINGFLYRYMITEVRIICDCHGSSFSPAEFVKHAGGTDISNPLRHIVMVPPAVG